MSVNSVVYFISFICGCLIVYCLFGCVLDLLLFVFMGLVFRLVCLVLCCVCWLL